MIEWAELNSGGIKKIGYDSMQKQLHVRHEDDHYIIYYQVRETEYIGMLSSSNMKTFYEENIKGRFPSSEVNA
jgi:hypothetical protein